MKMHLTLPGVIALALLLCAFSTGSPVFFTAAMLIVLAVLSSLLGVWRPPARWTCKAACPSAPCAGGRA